MISARLGHRFDKPLTPLAQKITLTGITPNSLTFIGFAVSLVAASSFILRMPGLAGILILLSGGFDLLDGVVARTTGKMTAFGAFLDSVLDRYSDAALFLGIGIYLSDNPLNILIAGLTLIGTFLISYVRARAEGLGLKCNIGLMERPERIILIGIGGIFDILVPVLCILLILTHFTVIQRIHHVWSKTRREREG